MQTFDKGTSKGNQGTSSAAFEKLSEKIRCDQVEASKFGLNGISSRTFGKRHEVITSKKT